MSHCVKMNHKQRRKLLRKEKRQRKRRMKYLTEHESDDKSSSTEPESDTEEVGSSELPHGILSNFAIINHFKKLAQIECDNESKTSNTSLPQTLQNNAANKENGASDPDKNLSLDSEKQSCDEKENIEHTVSSTQDNDAPETSADDQATLNSEIKDLLSLLDREVEEWHNPFAPEEEKSQNSPPQVMEEDAPQEEASQENNENETDKPLCNFYMKVGSCRFGERCSRRHIEPASSNTLLFPNMFQTFAFEIDERSKRQGDMHDLGLEYSDNDLYDDFVEFYNDILPEFETVGSVQEIKVCCNRVKHLCGTVYVQYRDEKVAQKCYDKMYGRFYNGKRLVCKFVNIQDWSRAVCGLHLRHGDCPRGGQCNFLHVFKNPRSQMSNDRQRRFYGESELNNLECHRHCDRDFHYRSRHVEGSRRKRRHNSRSLSPHKRSDIIDEIREKKGNKMKDPKKKKKHKKSRSRSPSIDGNHRSKHKHKMHSKNKKENKEKKRTSKKKKSKDTDR